jgi:hypothetical protein
MRTIIAGSRDFNDFDYFKGYMATLPPWVEITEVVSGGAKGPDKMAIDWAVEKNKKLRIFHADWDRLGKQAGPIRNAEMSVYAHSLIAFWNGESRGTKHMIDLMVDKGAWTYVIHTNIKWCREFKDGYPVLNNVTVYNQNARTA